MLNSFRCEKLTNNKAKAVASLSRQSDKRAIVFVYYDIALLTVNYRAVWPENKKEAADLREVIDTNFNGFEILTVKELLVKTIKSQSYF